MRAGSWPRVDIVDIVDTIDIIDTGSSSDPVK